MLTSFVIQHIYNNNLCFTSVLTSTNFNVDICTEPVCITCAFGLCSLLRFLFVKSGSRKRFGLLVVVSHTTQVSYDLLTHAVIALQRFPFAPPADSAHASDGAILASVKLRTLRNRTLTVSGYSFGVGVHKQFIDLRRKENACCINNFAVALVWTPHFLFH